MKYKRIVYISILILGGLICLYLLYPNHISRCLNGVYKGNTPLYPNANNVCIMNDFEVGKESEIIEKNANGAGSSIKHRMTFWTPDAPSQVLQFYQNNVCQLPSWQVDQLEASLLRCRFQHSVRGQRVTVMTQKWILKGTKVEIEDEAFVIGDVP